MSRLQLILASLAETVGPDTQRFMLRLLLLQLPHAPVIFFPEPCVAVLDTSGIKIVIVPLAIYSSNIWFHAVPFLTITLTRFSVKAGWYQPIIIAAGFTFHPDH